MSVIEISSASGLMFLPIECGQAIITSENDSQEFEAEYSVQIKNIVDHKLGMSTSCSLILPTIPSYHKMQLDLCAFSEFENADHRELTVEHDVSC